jgi:hypothetical protein
MACGIIYFKTNVKSGKSSSPNLTDTSGQTQMWIAVAKKHARNLMPL